MAHGALISLGSAGLISCFEFGIACPLQRSSDFQRAHVISCNTFNTRSRNQVQFLLFALISILRVIKSDFKKSCSCLCWQLKSDQTVLWFGKVWKMRSYFYKGLLHFSHCVGLNVIIEQWWLVCLFLLRGTLAHANRNQSEHDQSCWICLCFRQKLLQIPSTERFKAPVVPFGVCL